MAPKRQQKRRTTAKKRARQKKPRRRRLLPMAILRMKPLLQRQLLHRQHQHLLQYQHQWPLSGSRICTQSGRARAILILPVPRTVRGGANLLVEGRAARSRRGTRLDHLLLLDGALARARVEGLEPPGPGEPGAVRVAAAGCHFCVVLRGAPGCLSCDGPQSSATPHDICPPRGRLRLWS